MDLGVRQIRTAGKGSGSVELTLPGELRHLVGLPCRITLHDGVRPDIVLQPDLTAAFNALAAIWRGLASALSGSHAAREERFPAACFGFGLQPRQGAPGAPYLSWQDGLAVASGAADPAASARCIAACAAQYAADVEISAAMAAPFGAACGFMACGTLAFAAWQEPCDITASEWNAPDWATAADAQAERRGAGLAPGAGWQPGAAWLAAPDAASDRFWSVLTPGLLIVARRFAAWSLPNSAYPALCAAWRRGRSIELNRG